MEQRIRLFAHNLPGRWPLALLRTGVFIALLAGAFLAPFEGAAHPELTEATPAQDAIIGAPVDEIELWFTETVTSDPEPPTVRVLDDAGRDLTVDSVEIDPNDPYHVVATVAGMATGTYTVLWTATSSEDGHTLSGTFSFRVATGQAPGAATVEGERPLAWAVATRWLTFLAASISAAAFLFIALGTKEQQPSGQRRLAIASLAAALVGLIATLLEPWLQTIAPPAGVEAPSLSDAISAVPDAWWLRPASLALVVAMALLCLVLARQRSVAIPIALVGAGLGLIALLGLSLTSHASARESWSTVATASIIVHQWSVGLWVGGLAALAVGWSWRGESGPDADKDRASRYPIRRFSTAALVLAVLGIATGVVNSGLALPTLDSLWESDYGRILILKLILLAPVLGLAIYHRLWLRRHLAAIGQALRGTVRIEAALALLVAGVGVALALSALPSESKGDVEEIDLAAPLLFGNPESAMVRLEIGPAVAGENEIRIFLTDAENDPIPADEIDLVRLTVRSLNSDAMQSGIEAIPDGSGGFTVAGLQLSHDGWWAIDVLVRQPGEEDVTVPFYLMVPDPNINGFDAPEIAESNPDAEALFTRAVEILANVNSVGYNERLASGLGTVVTIERQVAVGDQDSPTASLLRTNEIELLTIGNRTWQRPPGGEWFERELVEVIPPKEWVAAYEGATGFQLGPEMEIDGKMTRVVTLYVPETERRIAAWYAWWIDEATGEPVREAMVSRMHYMIYFYSGFNEPFAPEPPVTGGAAGTATPEAVDS